MALFLHFFLLIFTAVSLVSSAPRRVNAKVSPRSMDRLAIFYDKNKDHGKTADPADLYIIVENIKFTFKKTRREGFCRMFLEHEAFDREYIRKNGGQSPHLFYDCETSFARFTRENDKLILRVVLSSPFVFLAFICCVCSCQRWCRKNDHSHLSSFASSPAPEPPSSTLPTPSLIRRAVVAATKSEIVYADIIPHKNTILRRSSSLNTRCEAPVPLLHNSKSSPSLSSLDSPARSHSSHVHWADDEFQFSRPCVTVNSNSEDTMTTPCVVLDFVEIPVKKSPTHLLAAIFKNMKNNKDDPVIV